MFNQKLLLPAEKRLLEACQKGQELDLSKEQNSDNKHIRGEFLRWLVLNHGTQIESKSILTIDPKGVCFKAAIVIGSFDFSFCKTEVPFRFTHSTFQNAISLSNAKIRFLTLQGCHVHSINAHGCVCEGDVFLREGFTAKGKINFLGAHIGNSFDCSNGKFTNENGDALNCNRATIQGSVFLKDGFEAAGKVNFGSASIGSNLECTNGKFINQNGDALNCNRAKIQGNVFLKDGFEATGEVNFVGASIESSLICTNGKFINQNGDADALTCNRATIQGSVFLKDGFEAAGKVNFGSASMGSNLECTNGKFINQNGDALNCNRAKIQGNVFLKDGFEATGEVNFVGASMGSNLECTNGKFINEHGNALNCNHAKIQGNVFFKNGFEATGNVNFGTATMGTMTFSHLDIRGDLLLSSAKINTIMENDLFWNKEGFGKLNLDGLVYNHLHGEFLDAKNRQEWLHKMPEFKPQPYKQLAKVLRTMGHHTDADTIMLTYNTLVTKQKKSVIGTFFRRIYGLTAGYGYKPINVFNTMVIIWILCGAFYGLVAQVAVFAPSNPLIFQKKTFYECNVSDQGTPFSDIFNWHDYNATNNWTANKNLDGEYTTFSPLWYSLDILLPIVDLQMDKDWGVFIPSEGFTLNHLTRWVIWFEILLGWIYSLIFVAIMSGLAKNEKD
jgi:hypothetical protein